MYDKINFEIFIEVYYIITLILIFSDADYSLLMLDESLIIKNNYH